MTQVLTPVADRLGTYRLIMGAALFKLVAGALMFVAGRRAWPLWALLFLGNRLAATTWGFYNLSFSDVSVRVRRKYAGLTVLDLPLDCVEAIVGR